MRLKAFFIMIATLLATLIGVARESVVVFENAETVHHVDIHPGSEYLWEVYKSFNPDIPAELSEFHFTGSDDTDKVTVHWTRAGIYFLKVSETDVSGCSNVKALAVTVISNNRSIGFEEMVSGACFNDAGNAFMLPVQVFDNGGEELNSSLYPLQVTFTVNGIEYSQTLAYNNRQIEIEAGRFTALSGADTKIPVEITGAVDSNGDDIDPSVKKLHTRTIFARPVIAFNVAALQLTQGASYDHRVDVLAGDASGAVFDWRVDRSGGTSTDLNAINGNAATIEWDGVPGIYTIEVDGIDGNGCVSKTISQQVDLLIPDVPLVINAGRDTIAGSCKPYQLQASVSDPHGLDYLWQPDENLDDATLLNPVFTPGESTTFILIITDEDGALYRDTVSVDVSAISADAGEDFIMEDGSTAILDATASFGEQLQYFWTTTSGNILTGETTSNPEINAPGTYILQVSDSYGCFATDSVVVSQFIYVPIANDDYDTTTFQKSVTIDVLSNDTDLEGELDPSSLDIVQYPVNGSVYINFDKYDVTYTPNDGFLGGDVFEYSICNLSERCDNSHVYVFITAAEFFIPEAFSPNGDNINDYFEIKGIEIFQGNTLSVINRWGKKVFEAQNYGISTSPRFWDGKSNQGGGNADLPTGTYFYVLDLGNGDPPIAGSVYIDR